MGGPVCVERGLAMEEFIEDDAERPKVNAAAVVVVMMMMMVVVVTNEGAWWCECRVWGLGLWNLWV